MSGRSKCCVPMKAPVANSKTRNSYDGALSANPGVPGSGGSPAPGGAQSNSVGSTRGWMHVQPAAESWPGVTPSAVAAEAPAPTSAAVRPTSAMRRAHLVTVPLMFDPPFRLQVERLTLCAIEAPVAARDFGDRPEFPRDPGKTLRVPFSAAV